MPQKPPKPVPLPRRRKPTSKTQTAPIPVEDPTPPPGPGHLPPVGRETAHEHRGFLLWAMMAPGRRSMRAVSRAIGVGDITIRRWAKKHRWDERVKLQASDRLAWQEYLGRYAHLFGTEGISVIQDQMDLPGPMTPLAVIRAHLGPDADARAYHPDSVARRVLEGAAEMSREVMGDPLHEPAPTDGHEMPEEAPLLDQDELEEEEEEDEELDPALSPNPLAGNPRTGKGGGGGDPRPPATPTHPPKGSTPSSPPPGAPPGASPPEGEGRGKVDLGDPATRKNRVDDYRKLIGGTLGVYARDLTQGKVKVTPRDAVLLIELEQALAEAPKESQGRGPVESVRVRIAREQGEDVLDALTLDHEEMGVVLGALRQKRTQDVAHLREEMSRAAKVIQLHAEEGTG